MCWTITFWVQKVKKPTESPLRILLLFLLLWGTSKEGKSLAVDVVETIQRSTIPEFNSAMPKRVKSKKNKTKHLRFFTFTPSGPSESNYYQVISHNVISSKRRETKWENSKNWKLKWIRKCNRTRLRRVDDDDVGGFKITVIWSW